MAQSNGDEELSNKLWAILDDYRNLEMPARYGNIDWAEHAIQQLWVADRKQHELDARISELDRLIDIEDKTFNQWSQKDIAHFFDAVGKRYRSLEAERSQYDSI